MMINDPVTDRSGVPFRVGRSKVDLQRRCATQAEDAEIQHDMLRYSTEKQLHELWYVLESRYTMIKRDSTQTLVNCRFACVEILFEVHLDQPPFSIPLLHPQRLGLNLLLKRYR